MILYLFYATAADAPEPSSPTPGHLVAAAQAQLTKDMFLAVLGETVNTWGINWDVLQDKALHFDDREKRMALGSIGRKIRVLARNTQQTDGFDKLLTLFTRVSSMAQGVHEDRLSLKIRTYFSSIFPEQNIQLLEKTGGVQMGYRVLIGEEQLQYYVKTHSQGRLSERSSPAKVFVPAELLVYKFLELTGLGPEVHFFQRDALDLYIATLDASFVKPDPTIRRQGKFSTLNACQSDILSVISGKISAAAPEQIASQIEACIAQNFVAQAFLQNIVSLDLLSRVFRLTDVSNNSENFGFCWIGEEVPQLRIIDFRIKEDKDWKIDRGHFTGFLEGNGEFNYTVDAKPFYRYILRERSKALRFETGKCVIANIFAKKDFIEQSYAFIRDYINRTEAFGESRSPLLSTLTQYHDNVQHNLTFLDMQFACHTED